MVPTFELGSREPGSGGLYVGAVHAACHMTCSEELSRLSIVQAMTDALEPLSFVQAFYEGARPRSIGSMFGPTSTCTSSSMTRWSRTRSVPGPKSWPPAH